mmetsp:Transcript_55944/g.154915  ORF Transcript_55944/g.154915 Transcript_55944/m.154915 type:complete len:520 (-) Transcript_55944:15-1574(-)
MTIAVMVLLAALLSAWTPPGQAQVFKFENIPVPGMYSLSTHYMFYVYSSEDSPVRGGKPKVAFRGLSSSVTKGRPPTTYKAIQVSILPYDRFWGLVNKDKFCSTSEDVRNEAAVEEWQLMLQKPRGVKDLAALGVRTHTVPVPGGSAESASFPIPRTGRYILTYTNCGNFSSLALSGSVAVSNTYGYLPANEYFTLHFFGWVTVAYLLVLLVWIAAMAPHLKSLFYIQKGIAIITAIALLEGLASWIQYRDWNTTGYRSDVYFVASVLLYTLKYVLSFRLILLAALGAGVVLQDLDGWTSAKFFVVSVLFMMQQCIWKLIMSYRFSHALDKRFLMAAILPGILMYLLVYAWTFCSLGALGERLEQQKQEESLVAFSRVRLVLAFGSLLSLLILLLQVADIAYDSIFSWQHQWIPVEGAPHLAFVMVLIAMMVVWWPSQDSWKFAYSLHMDQEPERAGDDAADTVMYQFEFREDKDQVACDEERRAQKPAREVQLKPGAVAPQPIGAFEQEDGNTVESVL